MGPSHGFLLQYCIPEDPVPSLLHPGKWMSIIKIGNSMWAGMWCFPICLVILSPWGLTHHLQTQNLQDGSRQLWKADLGYCINTLALVLKKQKQKFELSLNSLWFQGFLSRLLSGFSNASFWRPPHLSHQQQQAPNPQPIFQLSNSKVRSRGLKPFKWQVRLGIDWIQRNQESEENIQGLTPKRCPPFKLLAASMEPYDEQFPTLECCIFEPYFMTSMSYFLSWVRWRD